MSDLERLDEALEREQARLPPLGWRGFEAQHRVMEAARSYRDLLAKGVEPDYEAAAVALYHATVGGNADEIEPFGTYASDEVYRTKARHAVDAAIGDKLLVDPPTEEEE